MPMCIASCKCKHSSQTSMQASMTIPKCNQVLVSSNPLDWLVLLVLLFGIVIVMVIASLGLRSQAQGQAQGQAQAQQGP
jgi:hypothetical protein